MAHSKVARRVLRNHASYRGRHDLNVVPMIDMMVILVFFLIFTAVFTRTNVLQLNLPSNTSVPDLPQGLNLEVIIRKSGIEVADRGTGKLRDIPMNEQGGYDLPALSEFLQAVKTKYPDKSDASILLEQDISYDTLVQVMDTVRVFQVPGSNWDMGELFPSISVGDAPT